MKILIASTLLCLSSVAFAETIEGKVVSIADGDTITVLTSSNQQYKIRLNGIDAPEKAQPYGQASKQNLSALMVPQVLKIVSHEFLLLIL